MNLDTLIDKIIPPSDYEHRNGFNNIPIIEKLTNDEKHQIEEILLNKIIISEKEVDTLIVETLAYLKSKKALPVLIKLLNTSSNELTRLKIATSIFEINQDKNMIDVVINSLIKIDNEKDAYYSYKLRTAFYYLIKFKNSLINSAIQKYTVHKNEIVSYNAKRALSMAK